MCQKTVVFETHVDVRIGVHVDVNLVLCGCVGYIGGDQSPLVSTAMASEGTPAPADPLMAYLDVEESSSRARIRPG